jgi:hypothetical protein
MNPFFIASLPRSRTAWLANFLTYGESFCFHEPMNRTKLDNYSYLLRKPCKRYAGVSDSMNSLIMDRLIELFPDAKVVVILRSVAEVEVSMNRIDLKCTGLLNKLQRALERIIQTYDPLVIEYSRFDAGAIWEYLIPDIPLDYTRLDMLNNFNVTVPREVIVEKGRELAANAGDLLIPLLK